MAPYEHASDELRDRWKTLHGESPVLVDDAELDWSSAVVVLDRSLCFGTCPSYSVGLSADGSVLFRGHGFVRTCQDVRSRVPRHEAQRVFKALRDIHFLDVVWDKRCGYSFATDAPAAVVTLKVSGARRTLHDYLGDDCGPKQLRDLEELIDDITESRTWTTCGGKTCCNVCPGVSVSESMLEFCRHQR